MYVLIYTFIMFAPTLAGDISPSMSTATVEFSSLEKCSAAGKSIGDSVTVKNKKLDIVEGWNVASSEDPKTKSFVGVKWRCFPK